MSIEMIRKIPAGKTWGISPRAATEKNMKWYLCVRRIDGAYEIECGIEARHDRIAAHDRDEQDAFRDWDGHVRRANTAEQAAEIYATAKTRLTERPITAEGALR
jgi:hypothetical protein